MSYSYVSVSLIIQYNALFNFNLKEKQIPLWVTKSYKGNRNKQSLQLMSF